MLSLNRLAALMSKNRYNVSVSEQVPTLAGLFIFKKSSGICVIIKKWLQKT